MAEDNVRWGTKLLSDLYMRQDGNELMICRLAWETGENILDGVMMSKSCHCLTVFSGKGKSCLGRYFLVSVRLSRKQRAEQRAKTKETKKPAS